MKKIIILVVMFLFVNLLFVNGVSAEDKTYDKYSVGDEITIKNEKYYVITDSPEEQDYVTALKGEPLLYSQMKDLLSQTGIADEINESTADKDDPTTYVASKYLYSASCSSTDNTSGCSSDYNKSSIKKVVDVWATNKLPVELKTVDGYSARLIKLEELILLHYRWVSSGIYYAGDDTPQWLHNSNFGYWTMSSYEGDQASYLTDVKTTVYYVDYGAGDLSTRFIYTSYDKMSVRPVINIYKDRINDSDEQSEIANNDESASNNDKTTNITSGKVKVDDTFLKYSMIGSIIGLILVGAGISIYVFMKMHTKRSK